MKVLGIPHRFFSTFIFGNAIVANKKGIRVICEVAIQQNNVNDGCIINIIFNIAFD